MNIDFIELKNALYTPVIGDILDQMGYFHQFLPPNIMPIDPGMKLIGYAMPVLMMDVYGQQEHPFGKLTHALDDLKPGDVYIASGAMHRSANWGELLTATAKVRGAVGAVVDGFHRDTPQVLEQDFPVFSAGPYAQDSGPRMKVVDFRVPLEIGNILIQNGDLIFGDRDGVIIVPKTIIAEVLERALEKASTEKVVRKAIEEGMTSTAAFAKFGVL